MPRRYESHHLISSLLFRHGRHYMGLFDIDAAISLSPPLIVSTRPHGFPFSSAIGAPAAMGGSYGKMPREQRSLLLPVDALAKTCAIDDARLPLARVSFRAAGRSIMRGVISFYSAYGGLEVKYRIADHSLPHMSFLPPPAVTSRHIFRLNAGYDEPTRR